MTDWLDRNQYPFESHHFDTPAGRLHYVDEGSGEPVVFVHGNPSWSFMYRELIKGLSDSHRCIGIDHIGFGLSDKPYEWSYLPKDHAANLQMLLDSLDLNDITLVVHDWGGPIGLSYALNRPERIKRLVILNTWMWPLESGLTIRIFSSGLGGPIGRFIIERFNFFANNLMRFAASDPAKFPPQVHTHYTQALPTPESRKGSWVFPYELLGSKDWLASLWAQRDKLQDKPVQFIWGAKDTAFTEADLQRWQHLFTDHRTEKVDAGHYVAEEMGAVLVPVVREFLTSQ